MVLLRWHISVCCLLATSVFLFASEPKIDVSGTVTSDGSAVAGAEVSLVSYPHIKDTTDTTGAFLLSNVVGISEKTFFNPRHNEIRLTGSHLQFNSLRDGGKTTIQLFSGNGRAVTTMLLDNLTAGAHTVALPKLPAGFYLLSVTVDGSTIRRKLINTGNGLYLNRNIESIAAGVHDVSARKAVAPAEQLKVEKTGYVTRLFDITSLEVDNLEVVIEKESEVVECADFEVPTSFGTNAKFPDPFKFIDGTRLSKKNEWTCLREQLIGLLSASLGEKPPKPEKVEADFSGGKLNITCTEGNRSINFSVTIKAPSGGDGPYPAIITLGLGGFMGGSVMGIPSGIGEIVYDHDGIAQQSNTSSRGKGKFYDLYGSNHSAGAMVAWAWGVSRIIDALEMTEGHNINPARLGVTGCSRNGKGAMVIGAYDERIALTLPMEGGSGGISSWRIAKVENNNKGAHPDGCQTASQIIGENVWMSPNFNSYAKGSVDNLPTDAHTLAAIIAPRAVYFVEGSQNSWNCNVCCWTAASAARMVYQALGYEDHIGIVMTDHGHCSGYGNAEKTAWNAFCERFLLGDESVSTDYFTNDGSFDKLIDFDEWIDWEAPVLE